MLAYVFLPLSFNLRKPKFTRKAECPFEDMCDGKYRNDEDCLVLFN